MILHATNKDLIIKESERLISGSVKIYTCEFTFDESWDDFAKTVVFSTGGSRLVNVALLDNVCEIPPEVLRPNARVRIGIYGTDGVRSRPTTYSEWISVEQGADVSGDYAEPPTPSVFDQWVAGIDAKHDAWSANEQARVEAENARVEAEKAREDKETGYVAQAKAFAEAAQASEAASASSKTAAEEAKTTAEVHATSAAQGAAIAQTSATNALNYSNEAAYSAAQAKVSEQNAKASEELASTVATNAEIASAAATNAAASEVAAREAQIAAEKARDEAQGIAGGDFASVPYVDNKAAEAETKANAYTDQKISAIPTPDVSGQIGDHNKATDAHADIRTLVSNAQTTADNHISNKSNPHGVTAAQVGAPTVAEMNAAIAAIPTPDVSGQISEHNSSTSAHADIRTALDGKAPAGYGLGGTINADGADIPLNESGVRDFNKAINTGWYWIYDLSNEYVNAPPDEGGTDIAFMRVETYRYSVQTVYCTNTRGDTLALPRIWMRKSADKDYNTWGAWQCVSHTYGTTDLTAGSSPLYNGQLYFVYE